MPKVRVHNVSISIDGYAAGPEQSRDHPLGIDGERLHEWVFATRTARQVHGMDAGGETGLDDEYIARAEVGIGATVMGRNMFGPVRGEWGSDPWDGWWGPDPPFHHPVFVLTHHPHRPIEMEGGTSFHFVTDGIRAALDLAIEAAGEADVRVGGGPGTIQEYLRAGLIDEMHLAIVPILLGRGIRLFGDVDAERAGYECLGFESSGSVVHARFAKIAPIPR